MKRSLFLFISKYIIGIINPFNRVEVSNPPKITFAIGLCISFPGKPPLTASGIRASAVVNAVINIGFNLSREPYIMVSTIL